MNAINQAAIVLQSTSVSITAGRKKGWSLVSVIQSSDDGKAFDFSKDPGR